MLRMANEHNSLYHSINLDILGPVKFKLARLTRNTQIAKLWILQATCQLLSAIYFTALETHSRVIRYPVTITTDAGSQLKAGIRRMTRSQAASSGGVDTVDGVSDETATAALEDMVRAARKGMSKCSFFVAHLNSQHINGISEGNMRAAKSIMKSLVGSI